MRKIGINLYAISGLTEEEYIREAASLGFNTAFSGVRAPELQAKIGDLLEIVKLGVLSAPSLMVDGKLLVAGKVSSQKEIVKLLKKQIGR